MQHERIKPQTWTIEGFFSSSHLTAADVQRDYQWTKSEVATLMGDFFTHLKRHPNTSDEWQREPYFLGSIVCTRRNGKLAIYDGLQRSTTLTVLLAMLRDRVTDPALADRLEACVNDGDGSPRLILPPPDETLAKDIQPRGATRFGIKGGFFGRRLALRDNRNQIDRMLKKREAHEINALAKMLLEDVCVVILQIEGETFARKVFETTNMRGLPVEAHDLIKGRFVQFAKDEEHAEEMTEKWDDLRQRVTLDFAGFIDAISDATLSYPSLRQGSRVDQLVDAMAAHQNEEDDPIGGWLSDIAAFAKPWNQITQISQNGFTRNKALRSLLPIWAISWTEWQPLALELLNDERAQTSTSSDWLIGNLDVLQRRCMAVTLARMSDPSRRQLFSAALTEYRDGKDPFEGALSFHDLSHHRRIRTTLVRPMSDPLLRRTLLKWYELQGARENVRFLTHDDTKKKGIRDLAEVSHILPHTVEENSSWAAAFPSLEEQGTYPDKLGNIVLLPHSVREAMEEKSFKDGKKVLKKFSKRLAGYDLAAQLMKVNEWTPEIVDKRTRKVGEMMWAMLFLPGNPKFWQGADELESEADADEEDIELTPAGYEEV